MTHPWNLVGSVVVTGAARGTGAAIARRLAQRGAHVNLTDLNGDEAEKTASKMRDEGLHVEAFQLDVSDESAMESFAEQIRAAGDFIAWVNNAGINERATLTDLTVEDFERMMHVNVLGCFLGTRAAGRRLPAGGAIVNIASISAHVAFPENAHYGAAKGAIESFTRHAAVDLAPRGIRVNSVAPGSIRTAMTESRLADPEILRKRLDLIPLGRIGDPEDIAGPAAFLCTEEAAYITGSTLVVDGGRIIN